MANCVNCGNPLKEGVKFCTSCGTAVSVGKKKAAEQPKQQVQQPVQEYTAPAGQDGVISTLGWFGILILPIIPIVGLIVYFVWAFGDGNRNRHNFARAALILMAISFVLSIIFGLMYYLLFRSYITPFMRG